MRPCWNPRCSQPANWCGKIHKFFHSTGNFFTKQPPPERYYKFLTISFLNCGTRVGGRRTPMTALSASWVGNADFPFEISWQLENWVSRLFRNGKKKFRTIKTMGAFFLRFQSENLIFEDLKNCNIWEAWWRNLRTAVPSNLPVTSLEGSYFHIDQIRIV